MKRLAIALIASAALSLGLTQTVIAADMPARARPAPLPVAAPTTWSGFYIGGTVGGGVSSLPVHDQDCFLCTLPSEDFKKAGFVGGGHIGYNWQVGPSFLLGVEADFNWGTFKAKDTVCLCAIEGEDRWSLASKIDYFGTIRGRAGLISGSALAYVTGGAAYARIKSSFTVTDDDSGAIEVFANDSSTHWGVAVGAGVEYMAGTNWVFRAEYLYLDFLKKNFEISDVDTGPTGFRLGKSADMHIARIGLSYKFGGGSY
jgi:outer membrane immunogenic protein